MSRKRTLQKIHVFLNIFIAKLCFDLLKNSPEVEDRIFNIFGVINKAKFWNLQLHGTVRHNGVKTNDVFY